MSTIIPKGGLWGGVSKSEKMAKSIVENDLFEQGLRGVFEIRKNREKYRRKRPLRARAYEGVSKAEKIAKSIIETTSSSRGGFSKFEKSRKVSSKTTSSKGLMRGFRKPKKSRKVSSKTSSSKGLMGAVEDLSVCQAKLCPRPNDVPGLPPAGTGCYRNAR